MSRRTSLAPSSISTSRQSSLAYKGCSEPMNDAALQFKLSKKVAELTLVVHMLFTRNHEREVELESTKEAYEQEITIVSVGFEKDIALIKKELETERWERKEDMNKLSKEGDENTRKILDRHAKKIADLTAENGTLKSNYKALEERNKRLIEDHARVEREHDVIAKERIAKERAMEKEQQKIEKLQQNARANKELMDKMKENIQSIHKGVNQKIAQMEASSHSANEIAEQLKIQNDHLESENKHLKKKMADQLAQLKKFEAGMHSGGEAATFPPKSKSSSTEIKAKKIKPFARVVRDKAQKSKDKEGSREAEIEKLKREVKRYRLELKNREENFNKIFSDIKPVMVTSGDGALCCVNEIRNEILDPERNEEIAMHSYKQTLSSKSTARLRSKLPSLYPSYSEDPRPSTHGGLAKFSLPSDEINGELTVKPRDKIRPIRPAKRQRPVSYDQTKERGRICAGRPG